jgi:hypothetical protein
VKLEPLRWGRGSATITRGKPPFYGVQFSFGKSGKRRRQGVGPWQEVGAALLELGNDDLSRPLASDPIVLALLVVWDRP